MFSLQAAGSSEVRGVLGATGAWGAGEGLSRRVQHFLSVSLQSCHVTSLEVQSKLCGLAFNQADANL